MKRNIFKNRVNPPGEWIQAHTQQLFGPPFLSLNFRAFFAHSDFYSKEKVWDLSSLLYCLYPDLSLRSAWPQGWPWSSLSYRLKFQITDPLRCSLNLLPTPLCFCHDICPWLLLFSIARGYTLFWGQGHSYFIEENQLQTLEFSLYLLHK